MVTTDSAVGSSRITGCFLGAGDAHRSTVEPHDKGALVVFATCRIPVESALGYARMLRARKAGIAGYAGRFNYPTRNRGRLTQEHIGGDDWAADSTPDGEQVLVTRDEKVSVPDDRNLQEGHVERVSTS